MKRIGAKPEPTPKDKAIGEMIQRAITEHKVRRWLDGSKLKADRPTLAELESCGYVVKTGAF